MGFILQEEKAAELSHDYNDNSQIIMGQRDASTGPGPTSAVMLALPHADSLKPIDWDR